MFIPGTGILEAYTEPADLENALAMFVWAWFIVSVIFTVAATRSSWVLLVLLIFVDLTLIFIAAGYMSNHPELSGKAASATGFIASFLACEFLLILTFLFHCYCWGSYIGLAKTNMCVLTSLRRCGWSVGQRRYCYQPPGWVPDQAGLSKDSVGEKGEEEYYCFTAAAHPKLVSREFVHGVLWLTSLSDKE